MASSFADEVLAPKARDTGTLPWHHQVFHEVAYKASHRDHLIAGLDEFLDLVGSLGKESCGDIVC